MSTFNLLIIILMIVLPSVLQAGKKLKEKAEQEQRRRERLRQREEALRTGRAPIEATSPVAQGGPSDARDRLRQLERERQARLRELRERAQRGPSAKPAQTSKAAPPPAIVAAQTSPSRTRSGGSPTPAPSRIQIAPARPKQRAVTSRRQSPDPRQTPPTRRPPSIQPIPASRITEPPARTIGTPMNVPTPAVMGAQDLQPTTNTGALRHRLHNRRAVHEAIVLAELIAPPVSMRELSA